MGEIADGWLPFLLNPAEPELLLDPLRAGAEKAGRSLDEIDIAPVVPVAIHDDLDEARHLVRPWLAFYLGAMGAKEKNFYVDLADALRPRRIGPRLPGGDAGRRPRGLGDGR